MRSDQNHTGHPAYMIDFHSLGVGERGEYELRFDDRFFERWPESEVQKGEGIIKIGVARHASMLELDVEIEGRVEVACDRCLDPFEMEVEFEGHPVVRISEVIPDGQNYNEDGQDDGDTLWILPGDEQLDLGQYIYESMILSLPFQRVHPRLEDCNQDMLERFRIVTEEEFDEMIGETGGDGEEEFEGEEMQRPFEGLAEQLEGEGNE